MPSTFPTSVDTFTTIAAGSMMDGGAGLNHDEVHTKVHECLIAIQTALMTGNIKFGSAGNLHVLGDDGLYYPLTVYQGQLSVGAGVAL